MKPLIIKSTKFMDISFSLKGKQIKGAHYTNGTYALPAQLITPTLLAGFQHALTTPDDKLPANSSDLPIVVAINSDKSMLALKKTNFEDQETRAAKVAQPLVEQFPNNQVVVMFYDETEPKALYQFLSENQHPMVTLHKWGYGTEPAGQPKSEVVGADLATKTFGHPFPNDGKPICYDDTAKVQDQPVTVVDLRNSLINQEGVLFQLPAALQQFSALAPSQVATTTSKP